MRHFYIFYVICITSLLILNGCRKDDDLERNSVSHGIEIDDSNTGVPVGHTLTDVTSTIIVTEAWISSSNNGSRIIENKYFHSGAALIITVDGFTVQYCKFFGKGGISNNANDGQSSLGKNITITDCELDGNNENLEGDVAVGGSNITLKRLNIHHWPRNMWIGEGNVWVEECYMHDLTVDGSGAHIENIYVAGGANQTYIRNKLISNRISINGGTVGISASLAIYNEGWSDFPDLNNILVENNYFESDGGYAIYGGACVGKLPKPYAKNMTVVEISLVELFNVIVVFMAPQQPSTQASPETYGKTIHGEIRDLSGKQVILKKVLRLDLQVQVKWYGKHKWFTYFKLMVNYKSKEIKLISNKIEKE